MKYKPFTAMILAAGFGKRMQPLTDNVPIPLIKINNVTLLQKSIDFFFNLGCKKIIINTHYKHSMIYDFINTNYKSSNIIISYEKEILDTGGAVKNALPLLDDENILISNSDIFLTKENEKDIKKIILDFTPQDKCRLLLIENDKAFGIDNLFGDFILTNDLVRRWEKNNKILFYSGIQMINLEIINNYNSKIFSFNSIWDLLIKNNSLYGNLMLSKLFFVGDLKGYIKAIKCNA